MNAFKSKLQSVTASKQRSRQMQEASPTGADAEHHQQLGKARDLSQNLCLFARDFIFSLDAMIAMVDRLLEVVRSVDPACVEKTSYSECKAHVWAVAMGIKATAPRVSDELKRHSKRLEGVAERAEAAQALLERKARALQERNYYFQKLHALQDEAAGRGGVDERLVRNQEKLQRAQQQLDDCDEQPGFIDLQQKRNSECLASALCSITQIAACGWFISTGAVVCKALNKAAEERQRHEEREAEHNAKAEAVKSPDTAPTRAPKSVPIMPVAAAVDSYEVNDAYDPEDPLPRERLLPEPCGLEASRRFTDGEDGQPSENLDELSVKELRQRLHAASDWAGSPGGDDATAFRVGASCAANPNSSCEANAATSASAANRLHLPKPKAGHNSRRASSGSRRTPSPGSKEVHAASDGSASQPMASVWNSVPAQADVSVDSRTQWPPMFPTPPSPSSASTPTQAPAAPHNSEDPWAQRGAQAPWPQAANPEVAKMWGLTSSKGGNPSRERKRDKRGKWPPPLLQTSWPMSPDSTVASPMAASTPSGALSQDISSIVMWAASAANGTRSQNVTPSSTPMGVQCSQGASAAFRQVPVPAAIASRPNDGSAPVVATQVEWPPAVSSSSIPQTSDAPWPQ